ncbi:uncharacterized protein ACBT57_026919 [Dama dama]
MEKKAPLLLSGPAFSGVRGRRRSPAGKAPRARRPSNPTERTRYRDPRAREAGSPAPTPTSPSPRTPAAAGGRLREETSCPRRELRPTTAGTPGPGGAPRGLCESPRFPETKGTHSPGPALASGSQSEARS